MLMSELSALKDIRAVIDPAPAIRGNAIGTIEELAHVSALNSLIPRIISSAIINITNDLAMAKDEMFTPNNERINLPPRRNINSIKKDTIVILNGGTSDPSCLNLIITGMDHVISITANKTMNTDIVSNIRVCISCIILNYYKVVFDF
jgi:hypothetical protein